MTRHIAHASTIAERPDTAMSHNFTTGIDHDTAVMTSFHIKRTNHRTRGYACRPDYESCR